MTNVDPPAHLFAVFNEIGIIDQLASAAFQRALGPALGTSEFGVLNHLVRMGDGKTPSHLAKLFQITKPSMTAIIAKLERKQFVTVETGQADRRQKIVRITDAGREARDAGISATAPLLETITTDFPVEDLFAILPTLQKLRAYLDEKRNSVDGL